MVSRVAGHEFVKQCRRNICVQASHKAGSRTYEIRRHVLEIRGSIAPQRTRHYRLPGIVDVAESQTIVVREVVIHADQFFAPCGWCRYRLLKCGKLAYGETRNRRGNQRQKRGPDCGRRYRVPWKTRCAVRQVRAIGKGAQRVWAQIAEISAAFGVRRDRKSTRL